MAKQVSRTYGEALFEIAMESGDMEVIREELLVVKQAFLEQEDLCKILNHPKVVKEEKVALIENIFKGRVHDDVTGLLVLIVKNGRQNDVIGILDYFEHEYKEYRKIGVAKITSAIELSDAQKQAIEQKLLDTTVYESIEGHYQVDESLIGGLIIRMEDRVVDSSLKTKLMKLSRQLSLQNS